MTESFCIASTPAFASDPRKLFSTFKKTRRDRADASRHAIKGRVYHASCSDPLISAQFVLSPGYYVRFSLRSPPLILSTGYHHRPSASAWGANQTIQFAPRRSVYRLARGFVPRFEFPQTLLHKRAGTHCRTLTFSHTFESLLSPQTRLVNSHYIKIHAS